MNILLLGSGGREHAFAWKFLQSPLCTKLYVAPGNAGTAQIAENIDLQILDFEKVGAFCIEKQIDLVVVGPEEPLVNGIRDFFEQKSELKHILMVGANKKASQLEGSKDFSKRFMFKYNIPTAAHNTFTIKELEEGLHYLHNHSLPIVLKADGLAAGKGVVIAQTYKEAEKTFREMLVEEKFGQASQKVVVEQFLEGIEVSVFVLTDGKSHILLPEAKDYKRIGQQDTGLNTGGMGAVSPVPFMDRNLMRKIETKIIQPTLKGLIDENIDYVGFIFIGLMCVGGEPYVIEYNARMGDPETEVVVPRIQSDFLEMLVRTAQKRLNETILEITDKTATTVMLVSGGYPEAFEKNKLISNLHKIPAETLVFQAGTILKEGQVLTNGGRVMAITALGDSIQEALQKSNQGAELIEYDKKYYRKDIGLDLIEKKNM